AGKDYQGGLQQLSWGCSWVLGPSLVCMYQDHLTASVSLCLLLFGRPLLPASFHVAAQSCCFQASTGGQVALLLLLPDQHSR
ncbi:hypothetical protein WJX79_002621, partial [Trebouxia sp. C0005]